MSALIAEILPTIASLSRAEKFQLIQLVIAQLEQEEDIDTEKLIAILEPISKKSLRGGLRQYANPALIEQEQDIWQTVAGEKYERR